MSIPSDEQQQAEIALADARSRQAAPEMLEAIRDFVEWGAMTSSDREMFLRRFVALIAKAEGK